MVWGERLNADLRGWQGFKNRQRQMRDVGWDAAWVEADFSAAAANAPPVRLRSGSK
jgi:hypothetical protein